MTHRAYRGKHACLSRGDLVHELESNLVRSDEEDLRVPRVPQGRGVKWRLPMDTRRSASRTTRTIGVRARLRYDNA